MAFELCIISYATPDCFTPPPFRSPNGELRCSDEEVPYSPGDTCTVRCNLGYRLSGNATRTCQDDGTWGGEEADCVIGEVISL